MTRTLPIMTIIRPKRPIIQRWDLVRAEFADNNTRIRFSLQYVQYAGNLSHLIMKRSLTDTLRARTFRANHMNCEWQNSMRLKQE